ncbi:MAG: hypothetical protein MH825_13175 [Cyanobacteria bacterium]|nr:hypothetical protein [Cyanobacteriota bacterium]
MIILPGDPLFDLTLATIPPPGSRGVDFLVADSESGILRPANYADLVEYMEGGEYEKRMYAIGDSADPEESAWIASQEEQDGWPLLG